MSHSTKYCIGCLTDRENFSPDFEYCKYSTEKTSTGYVFSFETRKDYEKAVKMLAYVEEYKREGDYYQWVLDKAMNGKIGGKSCKSKKKRQQISDVFT